MATVVDCFDCAQKIAHPEIESMKFYPVVKNWSKKISPHLDNPVPQKVLVSDFNVYTVGRYGKRFRLGRYPSEFEISDWRCDVPGRHPRYFRYVSQGACHWLVNFNLMSAMLSEPEKNWRIVTSNAHSTVWDGGQTLFDLNGLALCKGGAPECFRLAACKPDSKELRLGQLRAAGMPKMPFAREVVGLRIMTPHQKGEAYMFLPELPDGYMVLSI
jgi:hypothetical protein